jgi:hypothetical protein
MLFASSVVVINYYRSPQNVLWVRVRIMVLQVVLEPTMLSVLFIIMVKSHCSSQGLMSG